MDDETYAFDGGDRADVAAEEAAERAAESNETYPTEEAGMMQARGSEAAASPVAERLEYLRGQIEAECISYGEIAELQGLSGHIHPSDVQLLEWAGVPEFPDDEEGASDEH